MREAYTFWEACGARGVDKECSPVDEVLRIRDRRDRVRTVLLVAGSWMVSVVEFISHRVTSIPESFTASSAIGEFEANR